MIRAPNEFFLPGGRAGVLLIHGLTGTPSEMRFVGKGLQRHGYTVYGMQLAGHCLDEAALIATGWRDWYASVEQAAERLQRQVDQLFVAGLSMGSVLALHLAASQPKRIAGLALYGTTLKYDGWAIPPIARLAFLLPMVTRLGIGHARRFEECFPHGIKDERIRARIVAFMRSGQSGGGGLLGNPWPSLAEFYRLARRVRRELPRIHTPCLTIHAVEDDIASASNARTVAKKLAGRVESVWLKDSYHMVTVDRQRQIVVDKSAHFFSTCAPAPARCPSE
jgi:carboxylesterase